MKRQKKDPGRSSQDLVIGRNTVREVLRHNPGRARQLLVAGAAASTDSTFQEIIQLAENSGVPVREIDRNSLTDLVNSTSHQSVALELKSREYTGLKELLLQSEKQERSILLALDSIQDPQNFGTLLRAAECFGVTGVIWSKNRGVQITPAVTKVSVGASELLPLVPVSNLAQALSKCRDSGFWTVATVVGDQAESLDSFDWPAKTVLVLGAEGDGVRERTARESDFQVYIPMYGRVDSLNVSQAGALLLHSCAAAHRASAT